jgi:hypothetical protein
MGAARENSQIKTIQMKVLLPAAVMACFMFAALLAVSGVAQTAKKEPSWVAKDWTQWSAWDCENILRYSPWAYYLDPGGRETKPTLYANMQGESSWELVVLQSALPIRQAHLRELQLERHYDRMNPLKKKTFDEEHSKDLVEGDDDRIVVTWSSGINSNAEDPSGQVSLPSLPASQMAIKLSDGRLVMPIEINASDHYGDYGVVEYIFPRTIDGRPLYTERDKIFMLVLGDILLPYRSGGNKKLGPLSEKDFHLGHGGYYFPIATLMYKGKLEY